MWHALDSSWLPEAQCCFWLLQTQPHTRLQAQCQADTELLPKTCFRARGIADLMGHPRFEFIRHDVTEPFFCECEPWQQVSCSARRRAQTRGTDRHTRARYGDTHSRIHHDCRPMRFVTMNMLEDHLNSKFGLSSYCAACFQF